MKTCYLNTVTRETTIALFEGDRAVAEKRWPAHQDEGEKLLPALEELLKEQGLGTDQIDRLVVCRGPGGFTSTRIGVSAANAWAFAKNIPVAEVSVFDFYDADMLLLISANANEGWVRFPGQEPQFLLREEVDLPASFEFGGLVHDVWKKHLEEQGGTFEELEERLPDPKQLEFRREMIKPWYYKEVKITWSKKNS